MEEIGVIIVGIVFIVLGIINYKGNISLMHSYHRKRVSEEDKKPFAKLVGTGIIIIGTGMLIAGVLSFIANAMQNEVLLIISKVVSIVALIVGVVLAFYAMIKYNKGIF